MNVPQPPDPIPGAAALFSLRSEFSHLNHGSLGAVPHPVQHARRLLLDEAERDPRMFAQQVPSRLRLAREAVAPLIGAPAHLTAFVPNATTGVALILHSLGLSGGDEIVTTDHGYPSIDFNIASHVKRHGVVHRRVRVPLTPTDEEVVEAVMAGLTVRTRLVILDHITSATARLFPVEEVARRLRTAGVPLLVDAAHVPGHVSVNVRELGVDFWVGNVHKWAYAPRGTGLVTVAPQWRDRIRPLVDSYGHAEGFPGSVEFHGTDGYTGWIAAPVGPVVLDQLGGRRVQLHNAALAAYGQSVIADSLEVELPDAGVSSPLAMRLIPLPDGLVTGDERAQALWREIRDELSCEVAVSFWNGQGLLRVAANVYNRPAEYDRLAEGLPKLLYG